MAVLDAWLVGLIANAVTATALLAVAWRSFSSSKPIAFLLLAVGLLHWLHAFILAMPSLFSADAGESARALFVDWRIYASEAVIGLGAMVYLVYALQGYARGAAERGRQLELSHQHARAIQDQIVQSLAIARLSLESGDLERTMRQLDISLLEAKRLISKWLAEEQFVTSTVEISESG